MSTSSSEESDVEMQENNDQNFKQKYEQLVKKHKAIENEHRGLKRKYKELESKVMGDPVEEITVRSTFEASKNGFLSDGAIGLVIDEYDDAKQTSPEMPNIKSITINHFNLHWKEWFRTKKFPNVEKLRIDCSLDTYDKDNEFYQFFESYKYVMQRNMESIFNHMEKLKHLYIRCEIPKYADDINARFKLESADVNFYYCFIRGSADTLKELKVLFHFRYFLPEYLTEIFTGFPKLEKLSIYLELRDEMLKDALPKKDSLKYLNIHTTNEDKKEIDIKYLKHILASTPELEELIVYYEVTSDLVQFLARTLKKLKKVIARGEKGIAADVMNTLKDLKKVKDPNINANFAICWEMDRTWEKEFADFVKKGN